MKPSNIPDELQAHSFTLVDHDGKKRASLRLGASETDTIFALYDPSERRNGQSLSV